jgi:hypothetical protein
MSSQKKCSLSKMIQVYILMPMLIKIKFCETGFRKHSFVKKMNCSLVVFSVLRVFCKICSNATLN